MLKKFFSVIIKFYQTFVSNALRPLFGRACRYEVTCSEFLRRSVLEEGFLKGGSKGLKRILSCHPFSKVYTSEV